MRQQQRSLLWNFYQVFYEGEKKFGSCNICKTSVVCSSGSTTGLQFHLKHKHMEQYRQLQEDKLAEFHKERFVENVVEKLDDEENILLNSDNESNLTSTEVPFDESNFQDQEEHVAEKILLSGENFETDLMTVFQELADDTDFTNVTLVTDGGNMIKAHKVVLSSFSPFFKKLLLNTKTENPMLYLRGVKHEFMRAILDFIYLGQARVEMEEVSKFMELASDLEIKGLSAETRKETKEDSTVKDSMATKTKRGPRKVKAERNDLMINQQAQSYTCHICGDEVGTKAELMSHIEISHKEGIKKCKLCEVYTADMESLREHEKQMHNSSNLLVV